MTAVSPSRPQSRWRRLRRGLAISLATFVVLGLVLELGVRLLVPAETFQVFANVYRAVDDPDVGYTLRPDYDAVAFGARLRTNSLGFRGPEWSSHPPPDTTRIALIGDSHAFGFGVEYDATLGRQLERLLAVRGRRVEVLNFGVPGYNAHQQRAVFERYALPLDPDLVILLPCNNDDEPARAVDADGWMYAVGDGADSRVMPWQQRALERARRGLARHSRLFVYCHLLWMRARMARPSEVDVPADDPVIDWSYLEPVPVPGRLEVEVARPLAAIVAAARERGIPVVLAPFAMAADWRRLLRELAEAEGIPIVELLAQLPRVRSWEDIQARFSLGWDAHLGPRAHELWARGIAELIESRGLLENR